MGGTGMMCSVRNSSGLMVGELLLTSLLKECGFIRPRELAAMQAAGMASVRDLLFMLPRRYEDRRMFDRYDSLASGAPVCLRGRVVDVGWKGWGGRGGKSRGRYVEAVLEDEQSLGQARFSCLWFSMPGVARMLCAGQEMIVYGRMKLYGKKLSMVHPDFELIREGDEQSIHLNRIVPVYSGRMGITVRRLREIVWETLNRLSPAPEPEIYEFVPDVPCKRALKDLHFPESAAVRDRARRRFALEECLAQQLNVAYRRRRADEIPGMQTAGSCHLVRELADSLPFELTEAQKRCVREIYRDMKAPRSMNRLLQGDVGSGKTLVALCAMLLAVEHGYSAVMMAPTQILAEQHYLKFRQMLDKLDVPVSLVTADRREESHVSFGNQGGIVVGTHALLYGKNVPERVGLVVIDEQHKFGVNQREKLIDREERPDVLVMTATPIPRTLTLTFYGELDVSILDGVPGGRGAVVTAIRTEKDKKKVLAFVRNQLEAGRQIYVVSPLIDGEDARKGKAVTKELDEWKALLPHVDVGLLHGRMPSEEKEAVMKDFRANRISVLVSTTVVEVGVDVPNATVMIINNAESFGLSQLHQLRGRIGRGAHKSYCILMTDACPGDEQWEKLRIVETTANGFDLAEQDLKLRGPGDVLGTSQSGLKGVRFEEWLLDARLIHRGRQLAEAILAEDPNLESDKYRPLRFLLERGDEKRVAG